MNSLNDCKTELLDDSTALIKFEVEDKSNVVMSELQNYDWVSTQQALEKSKQLNFRKKEYTNTRCSQRISPINLQLKSEPISSGIEVKIEDFCEVDASTKKIQTSVLNQFLCPKISHEIDEFDSKEIKLEIVDGTEMQQDERIGSHSHPIQNKNDHNSTADLYKGHVVKFDLVVGPETMQRPSEGSDHHTGSTPRKKKSTVTESFRMPELINKEEVHYSAPYEKIFDKEWYMQRHTSTKHTNYISHKVSVSQKTFIPKSGIGSHILVHTENKPHECNVCKRKFAEKCSLLTHMYSHTGQSSLKCDICEKTFALNYNLQAHMLTHTGERPYECDMCNRTFPRKSNIRMHMYTHTGERPYKCNVCNKAFRQKSTLNAHMLTHTGDSPHQCDVCRKVVTSKSSLKKHKMIHTKEKSHKCDLCKKSFTETSSLQKHMWIHQRGRPHKCAVCKKTYIKKLYLHKHMLKHTGVETC